MFDRFIFSAALIGTAIVVSAPAMAEGDAANGEEIYAQCAGCHSIETGVTKGGPTMAGLFGRTAGTLDGFDHSDAMAGSGIVWDEASLTSFLSDPDGTVPGTKMRVSADTDDAGLADLIAYLKTL